MINKKRNQLIIDAMNAEFKAVKSKEEAEELMIKKGILTKKGNLKSIYKRTHKNIHK